MSMTPIGLTKISTHDGISGNHWTSRCGNIIGLQASRLTHCSVVPLNAAPRPRLVAKACVTGRMSDAAQNPICAASCQICVTHLDP